jgi:uncharacterized protein (TIGR02001 family)
LNEVTLRRLNLLLLLAVPGAIAAQAPTGPVPTGKPAQPADTANSPWGATTGSVSLATDFIFRGISLTDHHPSVQGEIDWNHHSGAYLGAWGSNVHASDSPASIELDWYGGYNYMIDSSLSVGLGGMYYTFYPGGAGNTWEFPLTATVRALTLSANYSPHWGGGHLGPAWYYSAALSVKPVWETTLSLGVGHSSFASDLRLDGYADFHVGVSHDVLGLTLDVSGYAVSRRQSIPMADQSRVVFTMSKSQ